MGACKICTQRQMLERIHVIIEQGSDLVHVGNTVVILGAKSEALEGGKCRDPDCIKVPSTETREKQVNDLMRIGKWLGRT